MVAYRRWILFLLGWHSLALFAHMIYDHKTASPVWARIICVFAIAMLQYSWSFTVAMLLGPSRARRKWYCLTLLTWFIYYRSLQFIWIIGLIFGGKSLAAAAVGFACFGLLIQSISGILRGNQVRAGCLNS